MGKEILSLHMGQCGVQLGNAIWELLAYEHNLNTDGHAKSVENTHPFERTECFFYQVKDKHVPRAIMIDLEPTVIDELRTGSYRQFWNPTSLISGKEDAANNYARGYLTVGKTKMDLIKEEILKMVERTDSLSAFEVVHSYAGGTGSGLTALLSEYLADEYGKKFRYTTSIYPSPVYSQSTVDPYNCSLFTHASIDTIDCNVVLDNKALYDQCSKYLCEDKPSLSLINRLVASLLSSLFLSHRFVYHGSQKADCAELLTNLIPYPRIHFPMVFYSPLYSPDKMEHEQMTIKQITTSVFTQQAATMDCSIEGKAFLSCAMLYRGVDCPKDVYDALHLVKGSKARTLNQFVDWCPATFKIGLNTWPPVTIPNEAIAEAPMSVCMFAGNVAVADAFGVNGERFDRMFQKRCFIHWYVGEGMEEDEFVESREEIQTLVDDYHALTGSTEEEEVVEEEKNNENSSRYLPTSGFKNNSRIESMKMNRNSNQNNKEFNESQDQHNASSYNRHAMGMTMDEFKPHDYSTRSEFEGIEFTPYTSQFKMKEQDHSTVTRNSAASSKPKRRGVISNKVPTLMIPDGNMQKPRDEMSLSIDSEYLNNAPRLQRPNPSTMERNFNKPYYSHRENNSVATLPIVIFEDDDSVGKGDLYSECSFSSNQYARKCPTPARRTNSVMTVNIDGTPVSEYNRFSKIQSNTFLEMIGHAKPETRKSHYRHSSLCREHVQCPINKNKEDIYIYPQITSSHLPNRTECQDQDEYLSVTQVI